MTERHRLPFDWTTPAERFRRIVELLATATIRMAREENPVPRIEATAPPVTPSSAMPSTRGRIPFGERQTSLGRAMDLSEDRWLKRLQDLAAEGLSSEQIAKRLNQEDRESKRAGKWSRTAVWRILQRSKKKAVTK